MNASLPKVFNSFSPGPLKYSDPGNKTRQVKALRLNEHYLKEPYVLREYDIAEYINSFAADCDMRIIISRYLNGDPNIHVNTSFADVHNVPDLRAALDINARVTDIYSKLPADFKANFTMDQFVAAFGSEDGIRAIVNHVNAKNVKESSNESQ